MIGYVTVYRDTFGKNWILDMDGGSRERPGSHREGFASWLNAQAAAKAITHSWRLQYPALRIRVKIQIEARIRAHEKARVAIAARQPVAA